MIGKKRSGFQITSVTTDYDGGKEPANGVPEPGGGAAQLANGVAGKAETPPEASGGLQRGPPETARPVTITDSPPQPAAAVAAQDVAPKEAGPPRTPPKAGTGQTALAASGTSRFRVVKLDHALGEPYRRGRWTCTDLYDRDADGHPLARVLDGTRHVNSLDSHLEVSGLAHRAVGLLRLKPHAPKSQGSPLAADGARGRLHPASPGNTLSVLLQAARTLHAGEAHASPPRLPGHPGLSRSDGCLPAPPSREQQPPGTARPPGHTTTGAEHASPNQASPNASQPTSGEHGAIRKFSEPGSGPASPGPTAQDGSPSRKTRAAEANGGGGGALRFLSPMHSLASSMLSVGAHQDGDDDSGSSSSMVAIDNKIEQAMDLVKSHLMYAVREEVEVLKEQIKELVDRNGLLERENALLKSLADPDQLSQLPAPTPPSSSAAPAPAPAPAPPSSSAAPAPAPPSSSAAPAPAPPSSSAAPAPAHAPPSSSAT